MKEKTGITIKISGESPSFAKRLSPGRTTCQQQNPNNLAGKVLKGRPVSRTRRRLKKQKTSSVPKPTSCDSSASVPFLTASSSSNKLRSSVGGSNKQQLSGKIKFCTRIFLPLTIFVMLLGTVSILWIPPRHARRPYSSLADDYPSGLNVLSREVNLQGSSSAHKQNRDRRLRANSESTDGKLRSNFGSVTTGRCYDKGGRNLCSRANACTKHYLLCKCTCVEKA